MSLSIHNRFNHALSILLASISIGAKAIDKDNNDPLESFNRVSYSFNKVLDRWILKPVTLGYKAVTPDPVETGVSNVFANLLELRNVANSLLQAKPDRALDYTGRFIINSSFGLFGILDIATPLGIAKNGGEDFGQTLAVWGIGAGPYLVIPLFGPSTVRDGTARFTIDNLTSPIEYVEHDRTRLSLTALDIIDTRASLLEAEKLISGDEYIFVRDAYLQRRNFVINDGKIEDDFGSDIELNSF